MGRTVSFSITMAPYSRSEFDSGFIYNPRTEADICYECCNKIAMAQNKAIEDIKSLTSLESKE